jgi:hypothetical protein
MLRLALSAASGLVILAFATPSEAASPSADEPPCLATAKRLIEDGSIPTDALPVEYFLDVRHSKAWRPLRSQGPSVERYVVLFAESEAQLTAEVQDPRGVLYQIEDSEETATRFDTKDKQCPALYERFYRRAPILKTKLDVDQILSLVEAEGMLTESVQENVEDGLRNGGPAEHSACLDEDTHAPAIENRLQKAFHCDDGRPGYPTVCGVLQSRSLCTLPADHDAVRVAVATDSIRRLLDEFAERHAAEERELARKAGKPEGHPSRMVDTEEVLTRLPRLYGLDDDAALRVARQLVYAIARDAVRIHRNGGKARIQAIAAFLKCKLATKWGETQDPAACGIHHLTTELSVPPEDESLAANLVAVFAPSGGPSVSGRGKFELALQACTLPTPAKESDMTQVRRLIHAAQAKDDAGVFAAAIEVETEKATKTSLHALALATTSSLSLDRAEELELGPPLTEWIHFGIAVNATVGASYQPNTKDFWVAAPISVPIGFSYQKGSLYTAAGVFDLGQYLSTTPTGFRKPDGLDAFSLSGALGARFGASRAPLVVALNVGSARFLMSDATGYVGVSVGTFLPVATFKEK